MSKKSKRTRQAGRPKQPGLMKQAQAGALKPPRIDEYLNYLDEYLDHSVLHAIQQARQQMSLGDFARCISICEPLLNSRQPIGKEMRVELLALSGLAHGMLRHYWQSYDIFNEAIALDPSMAELWYNHGLACYYLTFLGEAVQDFERAAELTKNDASEIARKFAAQSELSRRELQNDMQQHEPGLTFEQYMERERHFTQGMRLIKQKNWQEAERLFRLLTETKSRILSYWGNLGVCLMMLSRYDEAEEALKQALALDSDYSIARDNLQLLPELRYSKRPVGHKMINSSREDDVEQSLALYEKDEQGEVVSTTIIESDGYVTTSTERQVGKRPPRYDFFLNPYRDTRFTTCPRCSIKTRSRKFSLVVHVDPKHVVILEKICRFCYVCGLLILHQDQLETQLMHQFLTIDPDAIGNSYQVIGTLDRAEWNKDKQDPLSFEQVRAYLHNFAEVVTVKRIPVEI
jgi:tetratricopeptide (TPR) repeat protein